jgi:hypothetical protein
VNVHISCQARSTSLTLQSQANSKMQRYIGVSPAGVTFQLQDSPLAARAEGCQNCANVFFWELQIREPRDSWLDVHSALRPESAFCPRAPSKASSSWVALLAHRQKFAAQTYSVVSERTSELFSVSCPSIQLAMVGATFTSHQISDSPTWSAWQRLYPVLKLTPNWHRRLGGKTQVRAGCNKLWSRL